MGYTKNELLEREKYNNACIYSIMTGGGFYVGSTRAMKKLIISYAKRRLKYGYEMVLSPDF